MEGGEEKAGELPILYEEHTGQTGLIDYASRPKPQFSSSHSCCEKPPTNQPHEPSPWDRLVHLRAARGSGSAGEPGMELYEAQACQGPKTTRRGRSPS